MTTRRDTTPPELEIRLLGGFEARQAGAVVSGFESQKVRGLLAYLAFHAGSPVSRDRLAGLLWPELGDAAARRNLRQALYNLRTTLPDEAGAGGGAPLLDVSAREIVLAAFPRLRLDVHGFETALERAGAAAEAESASKRLDPLYLAEAVRLYGGDLLAGFHLRDSTEFEDWLVVERERLREAALAALTELVDHHLASGTYAAGVRYARRLLELDPLSEESHRRLMRLYALSGRRSRALQQYEELVRILDEELGVEPMAETVEEAEAIRDETLVEPEADERAEPRGPLVPLVGRGDALEELRGEWREVLAGHGRLTLILGEEGIGASRLARTFLHEAASGSTVTVLEGRFDERLPSPAVRAFAEALGRAAVHEEEVAEALLAAPPELLAPLALAVRQVRELGSEPPPAEGGGIEALRDFLLALPGWLDEAGRGEEGREERPVLILLEDLDGADPSSIALLADLVPRLEGHRLWLLATCRSGDPAVAFRLDALRAVGGNLGEIHLDRLDSGEVRAVADALVGAGRGGELVRLLGPTAAGDTLPLALTQSVNHLWDLGVLAPMAGGGWSLREVSESPELDDPWALLRARIDELPTSTRRLVSLAAVAGHRFDAELLQLAEGEHEAVIETGLTVLLERWMIRLSLGYWADSRRDRDRVLWSGGPMRSTFEFSHPSIRKLVYGTLDPERRRVMHHALAEVLEERSARDPDAFAESLAHHRLQAGDWDRALPWLVRSAENAHRMGALDTARSHYLHVRTLLEETGGAAAERRRIERRLATLDAEEQAASAVS